MVRSSVAFTASMTYGFLNPEIDVEHEEWYKKHYPPMEAEKKISEWREIRRKQVKEPFTGSN